MKQGDLFGQVKTVSEITRELEESLSRHYRGVAVRGEISNFRRSAAGHLYFVIKDAQAQLKAVMFRGQAAGLSFLPADGLEVEAHGDITLYAARGDLQILVGSLSPAGRGALMEAFAKLKDSLQREGLFDQDRKQPIPAFPSTVALVTSPRGAAIRDLVHVARRRWPGVRLVLVPVRVQGAEAAPEIAAAVRRVDAWGGADVAILGRGGGSLEDLWPFNEEPVVRAISEARTPIVSAVGHESDTTLSDYAADVRAATPSAAAELVVPDAREWMTRVQGARRVLTRVVHREVAQRRRAVEAVARAYGFRRPQEFLIRDRLNLDRLLERLNEALGRGLREAGNRLDTVRLQMRHHHPRQRSSAAAQRLRDLAGALSAEYRHALGNRRVRVESHQRHLNSLSPARVLDRGYVWVRHPDGTPVQSAVDLPEEAWIQFSADRARVRRLETRPDGPFEPLEQNDE